jgi:hypothetical protein
MGQLDSYGGNIFIENTTILEQPPPTPTLLTTQRLQQRANANFFLFVLYTLVQEETKRQNYRKNSKFNSLQSSQLETS